MGGNLLTPRNARIKEETPKGQKPKYTRLALSTGRKIVVKAMLDSGMSQWQVAAAEGISRSQVCRIANDASLSELAPEIMSKTKAMLANRFYILADKSVDMAGEDDRMDKMSSYQLTMMGAVSVDKARLMDGLSTENLSVRGANGTIEKDLSDLRYSKELIMKRLRAMDVNEESASIEPSE